MSGDGAARPELDTHPAWRAAKCSILGASHRRSGKPNQDACLVYQPTETETIVAIADGHGSAEYTRSRNGAEIACHVARSAGMHVLDQMRDAGTRTRVRELRYEAEEQLRRHVVRQWREQVSAHIRRSTAATVAAVPITEHGEARAAAFELSEEQFERHLRKYGTTLAFVLVADGWSLYFQLGDGDIVLIDDRGEVRFPLPVDPLLVGTTTTSLVMPDAWRHARVVVVPSEQYTPRLVIAATDGLASSFEERSGMEEFVRAVGQLVTTSSVEAVEQRLRTVLSRYSAQGSGDDVTVVAAWLSRHGKEWVP
ncbi:PP2C family serine/threonine-protein phosphatase [Solirubrobacter soli]|uniref:PP2C family serine/threonine-protein phosphatase n=1 Tax=Solirubrobacter soli TaxID=363832 RepID=UPI0003FEB225|nr:PP2C family serine/threonine-protein phosphatase [Solirubrobacter soli]